MKSGGHVQFVINPYTIALAATCVAAVVAFSSCGGKRDEDQTLSEQVEPEKAPPPPPPPFPEKYTANKEYFDGVFKYLSHSVKHDKNFSYSMPDVPTIEPCLPLTQGAYEALCYGVLGGKINMGEGNSDLGSCDMWFVPSVSSQTCGNNILYRNVSTFELDASHPEVAYVSQMLGMPLTEDFPAIANVRHDLIALLSDYGTPIKLAHKYAGASTWSSFQPEFAAELNGFFVDRSFAACYINENEGQDLFNRIKMINVKTEKYETNEDFATPWKNVAVKSTEETLRGKDWMTHLLSAGATLEMMMRFSNERVTSLRETRIDTGDWKVRWQSPGVTTNTFKYIYWGKKEGENTRLEYYLNNTIWETYEINKNQLLSNATVAYLEAQTRCPSCVPYILDEKGNLLDNGEVKRINDLNPKDMTTWDAPTLVAWQLLQMKGEFGVRMIEEFEASAARKVGKKKKKKDKDDNDESTPPKKTGVIVRDPFADNSGN